jgi:DNA-binding NtrC family response regulator
VTVSILVVDDESDVADLYRQRFRREVWQGMYRMHFANSGEDALDNSPAASSRSCRTSVCLEWTDSICWARSNDVR